MSRPQEVVDRLVETIEKLPSHGVRAVAIDGVDGAGKTTFADALCEVLKTRGTSVIRASVDGFHRPKYERYRLGRDSPEGFYRDSYDYHALRSSLLDPLRRGGRGQYRTAVYDVANEVPSAAEQRHARPGDVLVLDGIFLHRPELRHYWDLSIFLDVPFATSYARMAIRDGSPADPSHLANRRYRDGQMLYLAEVDPVRIADILVDYTNLDDPVIRRG